MRILHLIHSEGVYGAELILVYLAREMQRLGHEVIVGSMRDPGTPTTDFEKFCADTGLAVEPIRVPPRPTPAVIRTLLGVRRRIAPDLIHSHGYKADILLGLLPRRVRGPMLTTAHGWTDPPAFTSLWLYQALDRLSLRQLDRVVVVAPHMLAIDAVRGLPRGRCTVIENGIPSLPQRLADQRSRGVSALPATLQQFVTRRPTLVAIGRLSQEKGFDVLLEAFAQARVQSPGFQLAIVGEGPERAALSATLARLDLHEHVQLAGYVEGADRVLGDARGFVMSSFTEGMPLALLEAMQWNVPIVATAVGAIPHILEQGAGGALVPPRDAGALAEALRALMRREAAVAQRTATAAAAVNEKYSSARMAQSYCDVYGQMLGRLSGEMPARARA